MGFTFMSKKRFNEIKTRLENFPNVDETDKKGFMAIICDVMNFDPDVGIYTKVQLEKLATSRKKIMEETGQSMYVVTGHKKHYDKIKKTLILKAI